MPDSTESTSAPYEPSPAAGAVPMHSRTVLLSSVVTHPANPRKALGDLTELGESIRELGVLQPPVVLPVDRVAAAWPDHAQDLAGAEWVVLMGARRRTAAGMVAGDDPDATLPVLVRDDAIADDPAGQLDVMTAENVARAALTPVEEARAFAAQIAIGRNQRQVAARMGCSQGHISKRLKLLKLPASMLAAVEAGTLEIGTAMAYVDAADGDQFLMLTAHKLVSERGWGQPAAAVAEVRREVERRQAVESAEKKLANEGVKVVDAHKKLGANYYQHQLRTDAAMVRARKDGHLVAEISQAGGIAYYSTAKPKRAENRSPEEQARLDRERAERKAKEARDAACAALVAAVPKIPKTGVVPLLADTVIDAVNSDPTKLAMRWLAAAGLVDASGMSPYQFTQHLRGQSWTVRAAAAYALALGQREMNVRAPYRSTWNATDAEHVQLLVDQADYVPSIWEQARLNTIAEQATDLAPEPLNDQSATPERISLSFDAEDACCWTLHYDLQVDEPAACAEHLSDHGDVDAAQAWAAELLAERHRIEVTGWTDGQLLPGRPAYLAVHAGDPTAAPAGTVGEWRLLHDPVDDAWLLLADDAPHAGHDGLGAADVDQACQWATGVLADAGTVCHGWTARADGNATLEYVADLTGEC
ncbi:hypothetical protein DRA43_01610 [Micromonospora provocatoris]|nr:hypothetical protein DRA43_01610 [Micromonospora provocatoris]